MQRQDMLETLRQTSHADERPNMSSSTSSLVCSFLFRLCEASSVGGWAGMRERLRSRDHHHDRNQEQQVCAWLHICGGGHVCFGSHEYFWWSKKRKKGVDPQETRFYSGTRREVMFIVFIPELLHSPFTVLFTVVGTLQAVSAQIW